MTDPYTPSAVVGLVQSDINDASELDYREINRIVREVVSAAGGLSGIVSNGDTVVLKPNIVATRCSAGLSFLDFSAYRPGLQLPALVNGITTDYRVTRAVAEIVRDLNPSGRIHVVEGSAWGATARNFRLMGYTRDNIPEVDRFLSLDLTGMYGSVESNDLVAVDPGERRRYPQGKLPSCTKGRYYLDRTCFEADVLISIPVLKNHLYAGMTGGIKNVAIGTTPCSLYGKNRRRIARIRKIRHSWRPLNDWIHDYYLCRTADFVVTDGLQGSQFGPRAQGARRVRDAVMNMRLVLAGADALAVDTVHACIVGIDPEKVDHLRTLAGSGAGLIDTRFLQVKGNRRVDEVKRKFRFHPILSVYYHGRRCQYTTWIPPQFELTSIQRKNGVLHLGAEAGPEIRKVELFINGSLAVVYRDGFDCMVTGPFPAGPDGSTRATLYAYDRFLNCTVRTVL